MVEECESVACWDRSGVDKLGLEFAGRRVISRL